MKNKTTVVAACFLLVAVMPLGSASQADELIEHSDPIRVCVETDDQPVVSMPPQPFVDDDDVPERCNPWPSTDACDYVDDVPGTCGNPQAAPCTDVMSNCDPVGGVYVPDADDVDPTTSIGMMGECLDNQWRLVHGASNGDTKFFIWEEEQSIQEMLAYETIDILITWDITKIVSENDFVVTYHSTAWPKEYRPISPVQYASAPAPRHAIYEDVFKRGGDEPICTGLSFDTGATYLGEGAEVTVDVLYEDLTFTITNTNEYSASATDSIQSSEHASITVETSCTAGSTGGSCTAGVGGTYGKERTIGTSETVTTAEGVTVTVAPAIYTVDWTKAVGGGGPLQWMCGEARDYSQETDAEHQVDEVCDDAEDAETEKRDPVLHALVG